MTFDFDELSVAISYALLVSASQVSVPTTVTEPAAAPAVQQKVEAVKPKDDDDLDLFGDDDEDGETEEEKSAARARKERMETARRLKEESDAKKGKKKADKPPEKSLVVLDVKPWEADTDLVALWHKIKEYSQDGLTWGETYKLEPVAYGINKLVMTVSIEDAKVLLDDITDNIEAIEEFVQSVTIASMNKI